MGNGRAYSPLGSGCRRRNSSSSSGTRPRSPTKPFKKTSTNSPLKECTTGRGPDLLMPTIGWCLCSNLSRQRRQPRAEYSIFRTGASEGSSRAAPELVLTNCLSLCIGMRETSNSRFGRKVTGIRPASPSRKETGYYSQSGKSGRPKWQPRVDGPALDQPALRLLAKI